jgi:hypothetical protein
MDTQHRHHHKQASPPLSVREKLVVYLVSACLLWTTWTIGGIRLWAQCGTSILALAALLAAAWPCSKDRGAHFKALMRFIPFWLGAFVAVYIAIQGLNASWMLETVNGKTRAVRLDYITWLPSGVATAWWAMNPWRMLLIFMPCWMVISAIWSGCRRPKAMRALLWTFALNGAAFAIIGILEDITKTPRVLWLFDKPIENQWFWGVIANKNHAAAFMNLGMTAALALFIYYTGRHTRELSKGGAYLMLIPLSVLMAVGVLQAMSRAGIVIGVAILVVFFAVLLRRLYKHMKEGGNTTLVIASGSILALVILTVVISMREAVNMNYVHRRMQSMVEVANDPTQDLRFYINQASIDLFEKRPAYGWGAGCYRYFIGATQKHYPKLMTAQNKPSSIVYAHNEYLNCLCDLGIVGTAPLFVGMVYLPIYVIFYRRKGIDGALWVGIAGLVGAMLHMSLEFFMQHPLVALQFALLLAVITRTAYLYDERARFKESALAEKALTGESQNRA